MRANVPGAKQPVSDVGFPDAQKTDAQNQLSAFY
jgi:hypothetical protein